MIKYYPLTGFKAESQQELNILEIGGTKFLQANGFPFKDLLYFPPVLTHFENIHHLQTKKNKQEDVGVPEINPFIERISNELYMNFPLSFDLQFLQYIDISDIDVLLLSNFEDLFLLPYICKMKNFKAVIHATQPLITLGSLVVKQFIHLIESRNKQHQQKNQQTHYYQESQAYEIFEETYNVNIQEFVEIFSQQDWDQAFNKVIKLSFGQIETIQCRNISENIHFQAIQNGVHVGSALWQFQIGNNTKFVLMQEICLKDQRHCLQIERSIFKGVEFCLMGRNFNNNINSDVQITELFQTVSKYLGQNKNVILPFQDLTLLLDLQGAMVNHFYQAAQIYVISEEALPFIQLANSNVCYLNKTLQAKIFMDPPQNPFSHLMQQKNNKIMFASSIDQLKTDSQKYLTVENMFRQSTPSIFFIYDASLRIGQTNILLNLLDSIYSPHQQPLSHISMCIILTDPLLQDKRVLSPIKAHIEYIPLDFKSSIEETLTFLLGSECQHIYLPQELIPEQLSQSQRVKSYKYGRENIIQEFSMNITPTILGEDGGARKYNYKIQITPCCLQLDNQPTLQKLDTSIPDLYTIQIENVESKLEELQSALAQQIGLKANNIKKNYLSYVLSFGQNEVVVEIAKETIKIATKNGRSDELENLIIDILRIKTFQ